MKINKTFYKYYLNWCIQTHIFLFVLIGLNTQIIKAQVENKLGQPNLLQGKVGAASFSNIDSSEYNPAQIATIPSSQIQGSWGLLSMAYSIKYPGQTPKKSSKIGFDSPMPIPKIAYKISPRLAIGGLVIPFKINQDINVKHIPLIILGGQNDVDIIGKGFLKGYANIYAGYALNKKFSIGTNIVYYSMIGSGTLSSSEVKNSDSYLAKFDVSQSVLKLGIGMKSWILNNFYLGISTAIFTSTTQQNSFSTLAPTISDSNTNKDNKSSSSYSDFFNPIRIGIALKIHRLAWAFTDIEYKRVNKQQKEYSLVDFTEKVKDVYDTISVYIGSDIKLTYRHNMLLGFFYEPSAVGPGGRGENSKAGIGFMDIALNLGDPPNTPQWLVGIGTKIKLYPTKKTVKTLNIQQKNIKKYYAFIVEAGITYGETSIGIDTSGEQPGAYYVQRITIPFKVIYNF